MASSLWASAFSSSKWATLKNNTLKSFSIIVITVNCRSTLAYAKHCSECTSCQSVTHRSFPSQSSEKQSQVPPPPPPVTQRTQGRAGSWMPYRAGAGRGAAEPRRPCLCCGPRHVAHLPQADKRAALPQLTRSHPPSRQWGMPTTDPQMSRLCQGLWSKRGRPGAADATWKWDQEGSPGRDV